MGRRPDLTLGECKIVIGMLIAGMIDKQIVRRYPVLEPRSVRWAVSKIKNHADRSRKTTRREDIDKVTSFRRNRFLSRARIPGLVRNATGTQICAKIIIIIIMTLFNEEAQLDKSNLP